MFIAQYDENSFRLSFLNKRNNANGKMEALEVLDLLDFY